MFPEPCGRIIHIPLDTNNGRKSHPLIRRLGFIVSGLCAVHEGGWLHVRMPKGWTHQIRGPWLNCIDPKGRGRVQVIAPSPAHHRPGLLTVSHFYRIVTVAYLQAFPEDQDDPARSMCLVQSKGVNGNGATVFIAFDMLPVPEGVTDENADEAISLAIGAAAARLHEPHHQTLLRMWPHADNPLAYWD